MKHITKNNIKKLLTLLVLLFSSSVISDDISDFQIEGISIGDNLLNFYNKSEIDSVPSYNYKNNEFKYYVFKLSDNSNYDYLQITVKTNNYLNNKYIIHSIAGVVVCRNDIEKCFIEQNKIRKDLDLFFNQNSIKTKGKHRQDKSNKSTWENFAYFLTDSKYSDIDITLYDNSYEFEKQGQWDNLQVIISSQEFSEFIDEEAWN
jgi:hypothetical protein